MSGDSSEEKTLAPSKKKLDDARKKGQVPHSKDFVGAATLAVAMAMAWLAVGALFSLAQGMMDVAGDAVGGDLALGTRRLGAVLEDAFRQTAAPALGAVAATAVLANIIILKGVVFSMDPIAPNLTKLNPAEGFKKLFSVKQLVELVKSLAKLMLLAIVLGLTLWGGLRPLALAPSCGLGCVFASARALALALMIATALIFIAVGGLDVLLQRWLFMRDQKMGVSEQKRERKEQDGSPEIKQARRRAIHEAANAPHAIGLGRASVVVHDGTRGVVGIRFVRGEMPVPIVVCRAREERAGVMLGDARSRGLPVSEHPELTKMLLKGAAPGAYIPQDSYSAAAMVLSQHGLV